MSIEIAAPDLAAACSHFPRAGENVPASLGPAQDCVINKIGQTERELAGPHTATAEWPIALKFRLHLVGDLHQLLHASHGEHHGNDCVRLATPEAGHAQDLHA